MKTQQECCQLQAKERGFTSNNPYGYLDIGLWPLELWVNCICCLSHPVYGSSLWQTKSTNTASMKIYRKPHSKWCIEYVCSKSEKKHNRQICSFLPLFIQHQMGWPPSTVKKERNKELRIAFFCTWYESILKKISKWYTIKPQIAIIKKWI